MNLVPSQNAVASFISEVQDAADRAGVTFVTITPELPKTPPEGAQVAEVRTTIDANGDYFALQDFMRRLYSLKRAVRLDSITMTGQQAGATTGTAATGTTSATTVTTTSGGQGEITLEAIARIFFQLPEGASAAAGAPAPAAASAPAPAPVSSPAPAVP
jgi:Tfp pilus assembly protein PilO